MLRLKSLGILSGNRQILQSFRGGEFCGQGDITTDKLMQDRAQSRCQSGCRCHSGLRMPAQDSCTPVPMI